MKNLIAIFFSCILTLTSCKTEKKSVKEKETLAYVSFGEKISSDNVLTTDKVYSTYKKLNVGDTVTLKYASKISEVCSKKGCWMKLPISDSEKVMVKFKDYGFFMPLDSQNKEVIVEGKAFVKVTPVDELRHYAEDAGKSKEEIEKIIEPKKEMAFLAHGVLMK